MTVSHAIVILLTLTCQLAPKSNSHISQSFVASVYEPAFFQCLFSSRVQLQDFNTVQQCIQISTRIKFFNVHTYILRLFYIASSIRIFILINSIFNRRIPLGKILDSPLQWWIQYFPRVGGGANSQSGCANLFFRPNCMKMKEFGPPGGVPGAPLKSATASD